MSNKIYKGDVGTEIILDTGTDLTSATALAIKYRKPGSAVTQSWVGTRYNTTKIKYITIAGDLDTVGIYKIQAYVVMPSWTGHGEEASFEVNDLMV